MEGYFDDLGRVVTTKAVSELMDEKKSFKNFVVDSLARYTRFEWGDLCEDDRIANEDALKDGERIFASYDFPSDSVFTHEEEKLWIITEWDRSVTTILFPSDY